MKFWTLCLIAVVGVSVASSLALSQDAATQKAAPSSTWEYRCILPPGALKSKSNKGHDGHRHGHHASSAHPSTKILNNMGSRGWELITIDPNNGHYCFKRSL
jgi:hypothetical protein